MDTFAIELAAWLEGVVEQTRARGMTDRDLAALADVSPDTLYRILRGEGGNVSERIVRKLAEGAGVPPPGIGRVFLQPGASVAAPTARDMVRDARVRLDAAERLLARQEEADAAEAITRQEAVDRAIRQLPPKQAER